jgi:anti-sigma factor RsiW
MMNCKKTKSLISPYIDNELAEPSRLALEGHLRDCPACRARAERLGWAVDRLGRLPRLDLPATAARRLAAAVDEKLEAVGPDPTVPSRWRRLLRSRSLAQVAAPAAVLVLAALVLRGPAVLELKTTLEEPAPPIERGAESYGADSLEQQSPSQLQSLEESGESRVFARADLDLMAKEAREGSVPAADRSAQPTSSDEISAARAAASAAAAERPWELVWAQRGVFEENGAWIVLLRLSGPSEDHVAVAVADDGRVLYRTE